ncbi:hypothetical protein D3C81_1310260 [compost metagenome]
MKWIIIILAITQTLTAISLINHRVAVRELSDWVAELLNERWLRDMAERGAEIICLDSIKGNQNDR